MIKQWLSDARVMAWLMVAAIADVADYWIELALDRPHHRYLPQIGMTMQIWSDSLAAVVTANNKKMVGYIAIPAEVLGFGVITLEFYDCSNGTILVSQEISIGDEGVIDLDMQAEHIPEHDPENVRARLRAYDNSTYEIEMKEIN